MVRHDVGLSSTTDHADAHGGAAEQAMSPPTQERGVFGLQPINNSGHLMDSVAAQLRPRAVGGFTTRLELQPQAALVRRYELRLRRFTDNGQVSPESCSGQ